jgi:hypothetical protein
VPASIKVTFHSFSDIRTSGSYTAPDRSLLPHGKVQSSDMSLFKFRKWWEIREGKTLRKPYDVQDVLVKGLVDLLEKVSTSLQLPALN